MTSVERIIEYQSLKEEPLDEKNLTPDKDWPACGEILFYDVSFSGDIHIDGIDIKDLSLKDLRKRLSIIPVKSISLISTCLLYISNIFFILHSKSLCCSVAQ